MFALAVSNVSTIESSIKVEIHDATFHAISHGLINIARNNVAICVHPY